jgi:hypothetical protein
MINGRAASTLAATRTAAAATYRNRMLDYWINPLVDLLWSGQNAHRFL